jgi:hypothetical protein
MTTPKTARIEPIYMFMLDHIGETLHVHQICAGLGWTTASDNQTASSALASMARRNEAAFNKGEPEPYPGIRRVARGRYVLVEKRGAIRSKVVDRNGAPKAAGAQPTPTPAPAPTPEPEPSVLLVAQPTTTSNNGQLPHVYGLLNDGRLLVENTDGSLDVYVKAN